MLVGVSKGLEIPTPVAARVRRRLAGVVPRAGDVAPSTSGLRIHVNPDDVPVPTVARFVLKDILGLKDLGRWEKTAWEINFDFRGVPMTLAHRKFGVRLEVWSGSRTDMDPEAIGRTFLAALRKAMAIVDKEVMLPAALSQLEHGNLTVGNRYHQLRGHYEYFREAADECLAGRGRWVADGRPTGRLFPLEQEAFINYTAAVQAYFSWLEHLLVLVLPFAGFDPANDDLRRIIGDRWRDKFLRVFDVASDGQANRILSKLSELSERTRNTWSHGAFDKESGLLYVHLPGIGATPMRVSEYNRNVHFAGVMGVDVDGGWKVLDEVDEFLRTASASAYGVLHAEAGFQVMFDPPSRQRYVAAMKSPAAFEEYLEHRSRLEDDVSNMDW